MGYHTTSDICFNVLHIGTISMIADFIDNFNENFVGAKSFKDPTLTTMGKWTLVKDAAKAGKKKKLYAYKFVKGEFSVFLINSSEYEMVGEHDFNVFSDDRAAVEEFKNDFYPEIKEFMEAYFVTGYVWGKIEDIDSIEQTI